MALVQIDGLAAFQRALKRVSAEYDGTVRRANFDVARELTVRSKAKAAARGGVANKAAKSLRASGGGGYAVVRGGRNAPYFHGAEFGALQYRQFDTWRGNQWGGWSGGPGYFLHPTIRAEARSLLNDYMDTLMKLHAQAFPS